ncbi:MAG: hypothetical protein QXD12_05165 [Candidatus Nezhaarchaeales archaeon]|nr:MAG: hypothetical protein DSO05_06240 [Candidatus Nezhaarchaeota archaeon WYZ-LMO7]
MHWKEEILSFLDQGKGFEVICEEGEVKVSEAKGISSKAPIDLKEIKGVRRGKVKPPSAKLRDLIIKLASRLIEASKSFKVTLGQGDFTLRFDLDHYIRVDAKSSSIVGFNSLEDETIKIVADLLKEHGEVRILKPLK